MIGRTHCSLSTTLVMVGSLTVIRRTIRCTGSYIWQNIILIANQESKPSQAANRFNFVEWHDAEHLLTSTSADVFAIFDSCNAGHLCQPRGVVRYEILGACLAGELTDPPGESSFTSALIWALKALKAQPKGFFGTPELLGKIHKAPNLRKSQQPLLAHRTTPSLDHIVIAPYDENAKGDTALALSPSHEIESKALEYIDIRLHFSESITDDHIKRTADVFREIISRKPEDHPAIDRISYLGRLKAQQHALWWLHSYRAKKSSSSSKAKQSPSSPPLLEIPVSILAPANSMLEVPLSATSKESGSSNAATMYDGDTPESIEPVFVSSAERIDEQTDQCLPLSSGSVKIMANNSGAHTLVMKAQIVGGGTNAIQASEALSGTSPSHRLELEPNKENDSGEPSKEVNSKRKRSISRLAGSLLSSFKRKPSRAKRVETSPQGN
jgi:hypothetical protein